MNIVMRPIGEVIPYARNPRKNAGAVDAVAASIKEFGFRQPIVVDEKGVIIVGHTRWKAAKKLGMAEIPVHVAEGMTPEQAKAYRLVDNKSNELAEWDSELLAQEIAEMDKQLKDALDNMGLDFGMANLDGTTDAEPQIDRAAELNKKWQVKSGDLWRIGEHRLLCGDSTKREDASRLIMDEKATLVFTDPPYGVSIGKKNEMLNTFQKAGRCLTSLEMDDMPPAELGNMLLMAFTLWREYMADDCSVFVCSPQGGGLGMMMMMMKDAGLEIRHILNWVKNSPTFSMGRLDYDYQHEPILFTWTKTHKRKKQGAFQTSLWAVDKPRANKEHATMKPIELPTCAILNHTDEVDVVVDMFGGSGTTMIAANNTKRKCRMVEISPDYCAVILERMATAFPGIKIERVEVA